MELNQLFTLVGLGLDALGAYIIVMVIFSFKLKTTVGLQEVYDDESGKRDELTKYSKKLIEQNFTEDEYAYDDERFRLQEKLSKVTEYMIKLEKIIAEHQKTKFHKKRSIVGLILLLLGFGLQSLGVITTMIQTL